uniref:Uncharacterized protein n=1 Tax=Ditylenchus dipsaci TaxID=166011 RepID=A0A915DS13_9BILA
MQSLQLTTLTNPSEKIIVQRKYIAKILAEEIEAVGKHKVVAVVTDHAANMRKAWEILEKAYPWILFEGCKAHMLNLAAKDICQRTMVALRVKFCQDIVRFFRKSKPQKILSKIQLEKMGSSTLLQLPIETRWGTYAKLINSIIANESCLKEAIWNAGIQDNRVLKRQSDDIRLLLCSDEEFWPALKQISKVITPLAEAIRKIEGNEVNSRSAYKTIKDAFAEAKRGVNESEFEFGNDMMERPSQTMSSGCEVATFSTTVDVPAAGQVTVKTQGGELYQVELAIMSQFKTFSQMYEDLNLAEGDHFEFPIPAVTSKVFEKVLQWCESHIGVPEPVIQEDPASRERIWFQLTDDEKTFFSVPVEQILGLLMAANYLDIRTLYLFGCQTMAALFKDKNPEQIRELLELQDDMTEKEKDTFRKKNVWCEF